MDAGSEERFQRVERALEQLQETAVVVAGIQARQAEVLKGHGEWLESQQLQAARHAEMIAEHQEFVRRHGEAVAKHDLMMAEIDGKLNALIDIVDHMGRRDPHGSNG
jgi:hypothetical protein